MTRLKVARTTAGQLLGEYSSSGDALVEQAQRLPTEEAYEDWGRAFSRWVSIVKEALRSIYEDSEAAVKEFDGATRHAPIWVAGTPWQQELRYDIARIRAGTNRLASFIERLRFAKDPVALEAAEAASTVMNSVPTVIFLVHGHNHGRRAEVELALKKASDQEVVILDEKASSGRTLIEKFEAHAAQARYAIVLLTGDDDGGPKGKTQRPRARQNVVFEFGFFCGSLGRERVCVLYEPDVEKPSDIDGLAYVPLDDGGSWKSKLGRELRAAGIDFDTNKA